MCSLRNWSLTSVNVHQTRLLPYEDSNSQPLSLRLNCSLVSDPVEVCSKLLVRTLGTCGSQTAWTVHVGRRCHRGRLIAIVNEQPRRKIRRHCPIARTNYSMEMAVVIISEVLCFCHLFKKVGLPIN